MRVIQELIRRTGQLLVPQLIVGQLMLVCLLSGCEPQTTTTPSPPSKPAAAVTGNWMDEFAAKLGSLDPAGATPPARPFPELPKFKTKADFLAAFHARMGITWDEWQAQVNQQLKASENRPELPKVNDAEFRELIRSKRSVADRLTPEQMAVITAAENAMNDFKKDVESLGKSIEAMAPVTAGCSDKVKQIIEMVNRLDSLQGEEASQHVDQLLSETGPFAEARKEFEARRTDLLALAGSIQTGLAALKVKEAGLHKALDKVKEIFPEAAATIEKTKDETSRTIKMMAVAAAMFVNPVLALILLFLLGIGGGGSGKGGPGGPGGPKDGPQSKGDKPGKGEKGDGPNKGEEVGSNPTNTGIPDDAEVEKGIKGMDSGPWLVAAYRRGDRRFLGVRRKDDPEGQRAELQFTVEEYGSPFEPMAKAIRDGVLTIESVATDGESMAPMLLKMKAGSAEFLVKWRTLQATPVLLGGDPSPVPPIKDEVPVPVDVTESKGPHRWYAFKSPGGEMHLVLLPHGKEEFAVRLPFPADKLGITKERVDQAQWTLESLAQIGDSPADPFPIEINVAVGDKLATHLLSWKAKGEAAVVSGGEPDAAKE